MSYVRRLAIAAVGALLVLGSAASAQTQKLNPQLKLLPNDSEMIVTINLQQILKSEALQAHKDMLKMVREKISEGLESKGVAKYLKKADFDLFTHLHSITFAIPGDRDPEQGFILMEGQFDADKIEAAATDANKEAGGNLKTSTIGNVKVFEIAPKDEKTIYIGVLSKKVMIAAATKADFADAVARFDGSKQPKLKAEVKTLLETINAKQSISLVATSAVLAKMAEKAPEGAGGDQAKAAMAALKTLDGLSLAITVQKDIDFQVGINTKDNKTASDFANTGNFIILGARAKMAEQAKANEKLTAVVEVLNTLRVSAQGTNLLIRGQVTFDTLGKALQNLPIPNN